MITVKRSSLKLLEVALGILFTAGIFYTMHYRMHWAWDDPGIGKLPQEIVRAFLAQAYDRGEGAEASRDYFSPSATDNDSRGEDRRDGAPIPDHVLMTVAQGTKVVVFHRIGPARGEPASDIIDVFETRNGRIVSRQRFLTSFARQ